jgi:heat shock protein HslJ
MFTATAHRFVATLLAVGAVLALAGCGSTSTSSSSEQDSIRTLTTSGNTNWVLVQWTSAAGEKQSIHSPAPTLLIGYQGRISGQAGVNDYVGNITVSEGVLDWGAHIAATRKAGTTESMENENHYLTDLKATKKVTIRNDRLIFTGKKPLRLEFARANP